jgi:hypothetical protein
VRSEQLFIDDRTQLKEDAPDRALERDASLRAGSVAILLKCLSG